MTAGTSPALTQAAPTRNVSAATVYTNGEILTMAGPAPQYVEAVVVRDGRIAFTGTRAEALASAGSSPTMVDLGGKTMLPGLVDSHAHGVTAARRFTQVDLAGAKDKAAMLQRLKERLASAPPTGGQWLVGQGHDQTGRVYPPPTAADLDTVSRDVPIFIIDASFHRGCANSAALAALGITAATPDPAGGSYARRAGSRDPDGRMDENAFRTNFAKLPPVDAAVAIKIMKQSAELWMRVGVTTFSDLGFGIGADDFDLLVAAIDAKAMPIDMKIFSLYDHAEAVDARAAAFAAAHPGQDLRTGFVGRLQLAGVKMVFDGVPPDTTYHRAPFTQMFPGRPKGYRGLLQVEPAVSDTVYAKYYATPMQVRSHGIGDGAIDVFLASAEKAAGATPHGGARPICEHCGFTDDATIARLARLGFGATFNYAPGPRVVPLARRALGDARMKTAMRTRSLLDAGVVVAATSDYPADMMLPNLFKSAQWLIVRNDIDGKTFLPQEAITPYQAVQTMTINAAWILKEEKTRGSIEVGKLADFAVVDRNPLKVDPMTFGDIVVLETIKEGTRVWVRPPS